jgi:hypothetical protein
MMGSLISGTCLFATAGAMDGRSIENRFVQLKDAAYRIPFSDNFPNSAISCRGLGEFIVNPRRARYGLRGVSSLPINRFCALLARVKTRIFISYRRSDAKAEARSIHQWLQGRFGREALFIDVDSVQRGRDFVNVLQDALAETGVLIALIGPRWLDALDNRQIDEQTDYVRLEIATALKRGIPIIPIRIDGHPLPTEADLPDDLKPLVKLMAAIVTHESFARDMGDLQRDLEAILRPARYTDRLRQRLQTHKRWGIALTICLLCLIAVSRDEILTFAGRAAAMTKALRHGSFLFMSDTDAQRLTSHMQGAKLKLRYEAERRLPDGTKAAIPPFTSIHDNWVWAVAQMFAAAPDATADLRPRFANYLALNFDQDCLCFWGEEHPNTVTSAWVLMSAEERGEPIYALVLRGVLRSQAADGWWSSTMDADESSSNASTYVTSLMVLALSSYREVLGPSAPERAEVTSAVERAVRWLIIQAPRVGQVWRDYPSNERSTLDPMFGAMAITAIAAARPDLVDPDLVARTVEIPIRVANPTLYFSSDAYISRKNGHILIDKYRHVPFPWQISALVVSYPVLDIENRARVLLRLNDALNVDFGDDTFKRQEWLLAEQLFLFGRLLHTRVAPK